MSTTTFTVTGVDFTTLPTRDLAAAEAFYVGVLGLERSSVWQRPGEDALGMEFETGSLTIALLDAARIGREAVAHSMPIALHVEDVPSARAALEARGVRFFGETLDTGVCHMAYFADPDGNSLMLHHRYAPREG